MTDWKKEPPEPSLSFAYKCRCWYDYHARSLKGRYEVYHFLEWLAVMGLITAALEGVVYLWRNG